MMNISTKSQPHRAYVFWVDIFLSIFFCILVSMATNETEKWAKKLYDWYKITQETFL